MSSQENRKGRYFFFGLFIVLGILVVWLLSPYLGVIALALVTVIMLKPLYDFYISRDRFKGRPRVATTLTILSFLLLIIVPLFVIGFLLFSQASDLLENVRSGEIDLSLENIIAEIESFLQSIPALGDIEIDQEKLAESLLNLAAIGLSLLTDLAISLGTSLPSLFIGAIIFLIVVATLLPTLEEVTARTEELSPLDVNITQLYLHKAEEMIISVIKGVFLLAILQGLIMGVFYWLAGVPFTIFWTLLSMAFAILPVVGISFIVLPMALIFFLIGNPTSAILILIGFYVFVNPTDLTLRPRLVSKEAYLNFTLMLLALFGGLAMGGLLGMIYGPVIMILFMTTIDIYAQYYTDSPRESSAVALESGESAGVSESLVDPDRDPTAESEDTGDVETGKI
jgi:predicted PurR-regulated permease PerM